MIVFNAKAIRYHKYSLTSSSTMNMVYTATPMKRPYRATSITPFIKSFSFSLAWKYTPMVTPNSSQKLILMLQWVIDSLRDEVLVGAAKMVVAMSNRSIMFLRGYIFVNKL